MASATSIARSEEHTSELQSLRHLVCRLLLEKKTCALPNRSEQHNSELQVFRDVVFRTLHSFPTPHRVLSKDSAYRFLTCVFFFFFFNDTATTEIYTLSLHDALPI